MFKIVFFTITVALVINSCAGHKRTSLDGADPGKDRNANTFAIMPFEEPETYPYASDRMREAFILAFMHKGYEVQTNPVMWDSLDKNTSYRLSNLNEKQAAKIGDILNVDLLIFGHADFKSDISSTRPEGLYSHRTVRKPIVIKAYDVRSDRVLLRERARMTTFWGLNETVKNYRDIAHDFVNKLQAMGYIQ